jgi:hypothetical protein
MKTRNPLTSHFSFIRVPLVPLLALASVACGAAPESQGVDTASPSAVEEGADAGPAAQVQGALDPVEPSDPRPTHGPVPGVAPLGGLLPDQPPPSR